MFSARPGIPRRVAEHEVVRPGPFGPSARRDEHLVQPHFGAPAQPHVPRAERPVLLPGPAQRTKVGQDGGKLRIAEVRQRQERPPPGQVVMSDETRQLSSNSHTLTMPDSARRTSRQHSERVAIDPDETSAMPRCGFGTGGRAGSTFWPS